MTDPIICVCESCAETGPLYLRRLREDLVAALCMKCFHNPNVERVATAQLAERAKEHSRFRARRRRAEAAA